ncbi:hypothetical protein CLPUN_17760 [Clostridium puniceum]|uniref:Uncharacterized protein n=1 Tax=Clostridium puniceum TaxID=29367 RepID=A0A1S8TN24_9CLOT|nr:hypothetical protein [Clostridium puniceum]OOM79049.1 hypothetical protein CLPUN_17760 [Clostridium puniceum]
MAYTNKMQIEISNIPKEKFDSLSQDIIRSIFKNGLDIEEQEGVEAGFSGNMCGTDFVLKDLEEV